MQYNLIVRAMGEEDVESVYAIEERCFSFPWSARAFAEELYNPSAYYALIECDGVVAAFAGMHVILDEAHVMNVATHPDYRHRGFARKAMLMLIDEACRRNAHSMTLEVRVGNEGARALYESIGFKPVGVRPRYYQDGEDALIYWARDISVLRAAHE